MKTKLQHFYVLLALSAFSTLNSQLSTAHAQGTAFTYQGQLQNNGSPASGTYALTFALFNTNASGVPVAGPVTNNAVSVTNGLFTTMIDFGPGVFTGATNWLQIGVATNGVSSFTPLTPRQQLTPVQYAIFAENSSNLLGTLPATSLGGTYGSAVTLNNAGNSFSGSYAGNGAGVTNVNAAALNGLNATNFWQLGGNNVAAGQFLGSTNNQPLEIRVGGVRAGWISPSNGLPNIVFGPAQNSISNTTAASSILGGINNTIGTNSSYSILGGGYQNIIQFSDAYSALVGGYGNSIQSSAGYSTLGGGFENSIQTSATYSFLGGGNANMILGPNQCVLVGGSGNSIQSGANDSFLGGGYDNNIDTNDTYSVLGGGQQNNIQLGGVQNFLGGGVNNIILGSSSDNVLGGGENNTVGNNWAFLGGGSHNTLSGITAAYAVLVGGEQNSIQGSANQSFLGGGADNIIQGNSYYSVIGGGYNNILQGSGYGAVLVGGYQNSISNNAEYSFLGGGQNNFVGGYWATVGGGYQNSVTANYATVPGGSNNVASGQNSFAAGTYAQATNSGAFVWSDAEGTPFASTNANSFNVRANGGVRFVTGGAGLTVDGQPVLAGSISSTQLPASVVTNNEPAVSLGTLTLGSLMLPDPTAFNVRVPSFLPPYSINDTLLISVSGNNNLYLGLDAGSTNAAAGVDNTGIGTLVLGQDTSGSYNTGEGYDALASGASGSYNTAFGGSALDALGYNNGAGGSNNIALGYQAAINFTGNESGNIDIGNPGMAGENNVIRIGNGQSQTYIAGVINGNGAGLTLPGSVVTNNEPNVTLGNNLTLGGNLILPSPANILSGGLTIMHTDNNANSYFGLNAGYANYGAAGSYNTGIGPESLSANSTGNQNVAVGGYALNSVGSGNNNIAMGYQAGINYNGSESGNIDIGNPGTTGENNVIRIGSGQSQTYLAGNVNCNGILCGNILCASIYSSGPATCTTITITGGSDLAEPFSIATAGQPVSEGAVVVIDDANPGQLKLTDRPYDTRVAGVVSGANGIHPGIQMHQQGLLEGGKNVALTGRVYVQADTSNGSINPGDLLTTSSTPGHAMKVTDHARAAGAILGKAMSRLSEGKGMVLVLVTLQ